MNGFLRSATLMAAALVGLDARGAEPDHALLARRAHDILKARCFRCHGESGAVEGGFAHVLDLRRLVEGGRILPGKPDESRLFARVVDGEMPPAGPLQKNEIDALREWIVAGAPDEASAAARPFLTTTAVYEIIRADLEQERERTRAFIRYLTITHLYNAGISERDLETTRQGISKAVNSLSFGARIAVPRPIDPARTVLRLDLRDYEWDSETWEKLVAKDPYRVAERSPAARFSVAVTGTSEPALRGDWFLFAATVPPLYHDILGIPKTDTELETRLGVKLEQNLSTDRIVRGGTNNSGVSRNNRMFERHDSPFGYYWKSYDFSGNDREKNIFARPLGPKGPNSFKHDGGEIIFSLPNGLQGYMLVDQKGSRINKGPIEIVSDPKRPDRAVVNGLSCMSCHVAGMIPKEDQVRKATLRNANAFAQADVDQILAQYRPQEELDKLFAYDGKRFLDALERAGVTQARTDPVLDTVARFEKELDAVAAASEVGVPLREFVRGIDRTNDLAKAFGPLKAVGGTIQREVFLKNFSTLVGEYGLGHETIINSIGMTLVGVPAGEFRMGSDAGDGDAQADEFPQHRVRITRPFYVGAHEVTVGQFRQFATETGHVGGGGYRFVAKTGSFVLSRNHNYATTGLGQDDDHPVVNVSYDDCIAFCKWLSAKEGVQYRLPTEAEWEYICRAGSKTRYETGDDVSVLRVAANLEDRSLGRLMALATKPTWDDRFALTAPVASYRPNGFGTFDLHGNVWEWCSDWYHRDYYQSSPERNPQGPESGTYRVVRGGCWANSPESARSADRSAFLPSDRNLMVGFRVVRVR